MSRYTIAPEARDDLRDVYRHIAKDNPNAAGRLRQLFFKKFRLLATQPLLGEAREDLAENLRMFTAGNYVILYRPTPSGIAVVQVVHSARDLVALWGKRGREGR